MKEMPTIPDKVLFQCAHLIDDMKNQLTYYFISLIEDKTKSYGSRSYNYINDNIDHQHHDFVSLYLKLMNLLNPILLGLEKDKIQVYENVLNKIKELVGEIK